jgi:hypothetical protein
MRVLPIARFMARGMARLSREFMLQFGLRVGTLRIDRFE